MVASTARVLRVAGALLVLVAGAFAGATEWAARRDRADADRLSRVANMQARTSAQYHGARAEQTLATRWDWDGHGTLGGLGLLLGVAMISLPRPSRTT